MTIREEYDKRIEEINSFYEVLEIVELNNPQLSALKIEDGEIKEATLQINTLKVDTLRSTTYLLLYNLVESTVYNSITSIFDEISDKELKYFDIIEEVQKYWLNNFYRHDDRKRKDTIIDTIMNVAVQIFNNTIALVSNEIHYGGSLDAQAIFKTAKSMRIDIGNIHRIYDENTHGQILVDIKKKRNWLAHGEKSFIDVGSTSSYSQLIETRDCVYSFLNEFISSVEIYITEQQYKNSTSHQQAV